MEKAVNLKALKSPIVHVNFKEFRNGKYKIVGTLAKQARGMMANYIIKNKINDLIKSNSLMKTVMNFRSPKAKEISGFSYVNKT
ncbi:peroxide stress protein YaaA [Echinicola jeungdonensis]|uniref:peroxide stress protein YaaA n=1 Tax=Echinicola jeungdonensis TaxID=709343 RepID=UPI00338F9321